MIKIGILKDIYKMYPDVNAKQLIEFAEEYSNMCKRANNFEYEIKNAGDTKVMSYKMGHIEVKDYESEINKC